MTNTVDCTIIGPRASYPRPSTVLVGGSVAGASVQGASMQGPLQGVLGRIHECTGDIVQWLMCLCPSAGVYRTVVQGPMTGMLYDLRVSGG